MDAASIIKDRLSVRGLSKSFGGVAVLNNISIDAASGEAIAIIGRSGAGKSTFLRCLTLLDIPDAGALFLDGQTYFSAPKIIYQPWEVRRSIVLVFQDFNLFPNMTVLNNISFALRKVRGLSNGEAADRAEHMARTLGISSVLGKFPNSLSGGQAQRCALARAMVLEPKVFLLDEITSALDPETILNVIDAIRELKSADTSGRMVTIFVTHLMQFAESFSDRIVFMHEGRVHEQLPARDFFSYCAKPETRQFVASFRSL